MATADYKDVIIATADRYGIPRDLLAGQVDVESGGNVGAIGDAGHSRGLLQIDDVYHAYDHARMLSDAAYALDYGAALLAGYAAQYAGALGAVWDDALRAYNGDWDDHNGYLARVRAARAMYAAWNGGTAMQVTTNVATVTGQIVADAAVKHMGEVTESDARNGVFAVKGMCQAFVQDVYAAVGIIIPTYPDAAAAGDAVPLAHDAVPPIGAQIFMRGAGWSVHDHTGVHIGGGGVVSALENITVSGGWLTLPTYRGWWLPPGIQSAVGSGQAAVSVFYADGNPYGAVPMLHPFWSRWNALDVQGLALPQLGYPIAALKVLPSGRRVQQFERGWLGTQDAPAPWDCVMLMPREVPALPT